MNIDDLQETVAVFKIIALFGFLASGAVARVKKTAGGVMALLLTSAVLVFGLWLYSRDVVVTLFDVRISRTGFLFLIAVLYGFGVAMIVRGRRAAAAAMRIEIETGGTASDWAQITITVVGTRPIRTISLDKEEAAFCGPEGEVKIRVPRADARSVLSFGGLLYGTNLVVKVGKVTERLLLSEIDLAYVRRWLRFPPSST